MPFWLIRLKSDAVQLLQTKPVYYRQKITTFLSINRYYYSAGDSRTLRASSCFASRKLRGFFTFCAYMLPVTVFPCSRVLSWHKKIWRPCGRKPQEYWGPQRNCRVTISDGNKLGPITPIFLDWPPSFCYKKHQNAGFPQKTTKNSLAPPSLAHIVHKNFRQRRRKITKFVNFA